MHQRPTSFLLIVFIGLVGLFGCSSAQAATFSLTNTADTDPQSQQFQITLPVSTTSRLTCTEIANSAERLAWTSKNGQQFSAVIRGFKANTSYRCVAELLDGSKQHSNFVTFTTALLPLDLKPPVVKNPIAGANYILYNYGLQVPTSTTTSAINSNYIVIMDRAGNIRWYYSILDKATDGFNDLDTSYLPFNGGEILYAGCAGNICFPPTTINLDKITKIQYATANTTPYGNGSYNHDAGLSADGKSIFALTKTTNNGVYWGFTIQQIDLVTNNIIWSWNSFTDGVNTGALPAGSSSNLDPYHANSVFDRWENGRLYLYLSMRNTSEIIKIDYTTKAVVWKLGVNGNFTLLEADGSKATDQSRWFFNQHDVKLFGTSSIITMHDNGADRSRYGGTPYSRALQLELNLTNHTAKIISEYTEPNWSEGFWGGYDVAANGNGIIAMGHCALCNTANTHNSSLVEINPAEMVVWRADFLEKQAVLYRSELINGCDFSPQNTTICTASN